MSTRNYITVEPRTPWDQGWSLSLSLKLCIDTAQRIFFLNICILTTLIEQSPQLFL